jgi:hypothetical protein
MMLFRTLDEAGQPTPRLYHVSRVRGLEENPEGGFFALVDTLGYDHLERVDQETFELLKLALGGVLGEEEFTNLPAGYTRALLIGKRQAQAVAQAGGGLTEGSETGGTA